MNSPAASIPLAYRQPVWGQLDRALKNSFRSSGILGLLILIAVFVVPRPAEDQLSLEKMPERFARLILEKPKAPAAAPGKLAALEAPKVEEPAKVVTPMPATQPKPSTRRRADRPKADPDAGRKGREMATAQVAVSLDEVQGSLDKVLENLSAALPAADAGSSTSGTSRRRSRKVRSGRDRTELAAVGGVQTTDATQIGSGGLEGNGITISSIAELGGDGAGDGGSSGGSLEGGSEGGGGEFRSSASLLAVVRRYAAGIQFCYDNQLKKEPGLRGKLVVTLTVLASGEVSQADVAQNKLGSDAVVDCVLAQIRAWQFPGIPTGVVSFKTPFVFTPPE
jgi:outer membrane biosynthesis protein TonB